MRPATGQIVRWTPPGNVRNFRARVAAKHPGGGYVLWVPLISRWSRAFASDIEADTTNAPIKEPRMDRCATDRCRNDPVMTYLGKPLCEACWQSAAAEAPQIGPPPDVDERIAAAPASEIPYEKRVARATRSQNEEPTTEGDNDMATKKTSSKKSNKTTKAAKATRTKAPKAERKPATDAKPKRVSALDAAAQVLKASGQAMRSGEMIAAMAEQGLWSSPNGKTPEATLYAAILREINVKGKAARFRKAERGKFEFVNDA